MTPDPAREGLLCVVSGPSGSGKTTLCRAATAVEPVYYTVSCTTRPQRAGEENGRDYFFLTEEEFVQRIEDGGFLEHAYVHGRRYGTLKSEVLPALAAGQDVIMDLDIQGAGQLRDCSDETIRRALVDVFIMPAGMDDLRARLAGRSSESEAELDLRLKNAMAEMRHWREYRYTILSHTREADLAAFLAILHAERLRSHRLRCHAHFPA
ncbi:MAG TPA: guanylate kinase [Verrucomicrobiales bacterium]|nr:guanylate kinase [Verrucomicrobiales bacterium]